MAVAQCISHCVLVVCGTSCLVGFSWVCSMYPRLALNSPSLFSFFSFLSTGLIGTCYCAWCSRSSCLVLTPWSSLLITCISPYTALFMFPLTTEKMSSSSFWHLRLFHSSLALPDSSIISEAIPQPPTSHNHTNPILFHLGHVTCGGVNHCIPSLSLSL